jgi:hypothetical protein
MLMEMETPIPPEDLARLRAAIERADPSAALRLRVGRQITRAQEQRARRRRMSIGALAAGGALAVSVAVLVLPHGSPPSVAQVVRIAAEAPRAPAPPLDAANPRRLTAHVDDLWFPSWRGHRWRAVGRTSKTVAGRDTVTVYYGRDDGARIAYTILGGGALPWPADSRAVTHGWMRLHVYTDDGRRVVTWRWRGHQCVIVGPRSVPETTLLALSEDET